MKPTPKTAKAIRKNLKRLKDARGLLLNVDHSLFETGLKTTAVNRAIDCIDQALTGNPALSETTHRDIAEGLKRAGVSARSVSVAIAPPKKKNRK